MTHSETIGRFKRLCSRAWNDPVGSQIISVAVLACAGALWSLCGRLGIFPAPVDVWNRVGPWLGTSRPTPTWALLLLPAGGAFVLFLLQRATRRGRLALVPDSRGYVTDELLGMRWRWTWATSGNEPRNLIAYCSTCDMEIVAHQRGDGLVQSFSVVLRCDRCHRDVGPFTGMPVDVRDQARRLIERNRREKDGTHTVT